jgi:UDP-N-acetylmuramyl tripeptide synthase
LKDGVTYVRVAGQLPTRSVWLAANFHDHRLRKLKLVGITGTNGKTSTATLLFRLFRRWATSAASSARWRSASASAPSRARTPRPMRCA